MLGIYENLPEDLLQEIWFETHKGNGSMVKKSIVQKKFLMEWISTIIILTQKLIDNLDSDTFVVNYFVYARIEVRNNLIYTWLRNFRLFKLICTKERMFKLFNKLISDYFVLYYIKMLLTDKTIKTSKKYVCCPSSGSILFPVYSVPANKSPLSYFCEKFFYKNNYQGKSVRTWKKAFEVLWLEDI